MHHEKLPCVRSWAHAVPAIASGLVRLSVHTVEKEINQKLINSINKSKQLFRVEIFHVAGTNRYFVHCETSRHLMSF